MSGCRNHGTQPLPVRAFASTLQTALLKSRRGLGCEFEHRVTEQEQAKRFYVSGKVQGVGYRFFARRIASQLGLSGYVKNLSDGRVEVYAVGISSQLQTLLEELRHGPSYAQVERVDDQAAEVSQRWSQSFSIEDE
jgi:acylphosphatase